MTSVTTVALVSVDNSSMETKHNTPILAAVQRMHSEDDTQLGSDPYNTARHRVLQVADMYSDAQRREAAATLACFETELSL